MNSFTFAAARFVLFCLFLAPVLSRAQQTVRFEQLSFEEAMAKAKKEKKIIFTDVRRSEPTEIDERVAHEVFPTDSVASFFRDNCIAIRIDMLTEEGKKFGPRLAMLMYPAYVFYASNGDQLEFTNAGTVVKNPAVLMEKARASLKVAAEKMANHRSITFTKDNWAGLLARAKKENKLIFLDAHTEWCRPCIMMAKDVFTLDRVADFYNKSFINAEMDMEKGEGPGLAKKYAIDAYPTFLYIDGDGNLVSRDGGYQEADKFIKAGQTALDKKAATAEAVPFGMPMALVQPPVPNGSAAPVKTGFAVPEEKPSAIHFTEGSWQAILDEAKKTGKLIFMDAYTSWCGPCKQMRAKVFTQESVGNLFNRNFVNAYIDMEKGEGPALSKKYAVRAYPTYLFINGEGEVVHRVVGSCSTDEFIQHGLDAISPLRSLSFFQKEYPSRTQDPDFIRQYLEALDMAYEADKADTLALDYLQSIHPGKWLERENYLLIKKYVKDASSPVFMYLVNNRPQFSALYGEEEVAGQIYSTFLAWPIHYLSFSKSAAPVLNKEGYDQFLQQLAASNYDRREEISNKSALTIALSLRDWEGYVQTVNRMLAGKQIPVNNAGATDLFSYASNVNRLSDNNKAALENATQWAGILVSDHKELNAYRKAEAQSLYAELLEKTGKKKEAANVRKQISQEDLSNAQKGSPLQMLRISGK